MKLYRSIVMIVVAAASTWIPSSAEGALIRFCVKHTGVFTDNNVAINGATEDYWTDDFRKPALGQSMEVWKSGVLLWSGYGTTSEAAPGQGCTAQMNQPTPNGTYSIRLWSRGSAGGYPIEVWSAVGEPVEILGSATNYSINDNGALANYPVDLSINAGTNIYEVFNVYLAVAWGLWRMPGPQPGSLFRVERNLTQNGYSYAGGICGCPTIFIKTGATTGRKFQILHSVGHRIGHLATPTADQPPRGVMNDAQNYDWYDPLCPRDVVAQNPPIACDPLPVLPPAGVAGDGDGLEDGGFGGVQVPGPCTGACLPANCSPMHEVRSMEYVGSAAGEGFVDFYSAAAFNEQSVDADCVFRAFLPLQGNQIVDCEAASPGMPLAYMRNTCSSPNSTNGVQLDWMRAFWDMRTNTNTFGVPPTFIEMITWLDQTPAWNKTTAFVNLDVQANLQGFRLNYAWDTAVASGTADGNGL